MQDYKAFYDTNNLKITIREEDLMEEEKNECIKIFNVEINVDFEALSKKELIHESLLRKL